MLFPIVGKLPDDKLTVDGATYSMPQHGLARISEFDLVASDATSCIYRLSSSEATRAVYPFDFRLDVRYALEAATLTVDAEVTNCGASPLPVSFGFHPAFLWPLPDGGTKTDHRLVFEHDEPAPVRRLRGGLLRADPVQSPVQDRILALSDDLFAEDVVFLDRPWSRRVDYFSPGGPTIRVRFPGMPHLGLWSKPGAGFLCIEPWQGHATPEGFSGELAEKPGMILLPAGGAKRFGMSIEILPKAD